MNAPDRLIDWSALNQRLLVAEFTRLKGRLEPGSPHVADGADQQVAAVRAELAALSQPSAIDSMAEAFGLSSFERDLLLLAAGVEMDARLAALCGEATGDARRPWASFGLALQHLRDPHWSALSPRRPLRRWRLVDVESGASLATAKLSIDERVLHALAGVDYLDPRLEPLVRPVPAPDVMAPAHAEVCDALSSGLSQRDSPLPLPLVHLYGPDRHGGEDIAAECAARLGLQLWAIDSTRLPGSASELADFIVLCEREALLGAGAWFIDFADELPPPAALHAVQRLHGVVFLWSFAGHDWDRFEASLRPVLAYAVEHPSRSERRALWQEALGADAPALATMVASAAAQFQFSTRTIGDKAAALAASGPPDGDALWAACRGAMPGTLGGLARRIDSSASWSQLVLPEAQMQSLRQIELHMRHRHTVYDEWGFGAKGARGLGISALFAGESGTGKTLAAEVLAHALNLTLYRVDLSAVVSKYIGETEKNLRQVFDAAENLGAMLLFDEADALFGKRSEVKDSHDRYANIEVGYLLQRMEAFQGLAVLTTNHRSALDPAFTRRLRFVVLFSFPDQSQREAIWRASFPPQTPTSAIDWGRLARLDVTGGTIRNVVMAAAFLAAEKATPVGMSHLLRAAQLDAAKREKPLTGAQTRDWA
ncbi:ATP-binding protein [Xylophilus sp. GOD-11R]|uniref:ATP-binding protein n=1 Tax=Xylophilus sp. GOD-11R TaxID=3089814 RepID=UPI00298CAE63|nr:ATP-binding protein [Xylophilus sp. GOD-11R]WPB55030.1 ATP-binding protein [Xylophilus sp. GOD-11R]